MNETIKPAIPIKDPERILERKKKGWQELGLSVSGHPIIYKYLNSGKNASRILLLGGVHGNETEGIQFMHDFCLEFIDNNTKSPFEQSLLTIPVLNPDGFLNYKRKNANGVDLNRNMLTKDWSEKYSEEKYFPGKEPNSEPETKYLIQMIESFQPNYIISFHSFKPMINYNGPAVKYAKNIAKHLNIPITDDIGYPTPGSLGTYAGHEKRIPTITLEFERGTPLKEIYPMAKDGILNSFDST